MVIFVAKMKLVVRKADQKNVDKILKKGFRAPPGGHVLDEFRGRCLVNDSQIGKTEKTNSNLNKD